MGLGVPAAGEGSKRGSPRPGGLRLSCLPALIPTVSAMLREITRLFEVSDHRRNVSCELGHPEFLKVSVTGLRSKDAMLFLL